MGTQQSTCPVRCADGWRKIINGESRHWGYAGSYQNTEEGSAIYMEKKVDLSQGLRMGRKLFRTTIGTDEGWNITLA